MNKTAMKRGVDLLMTAALPALMSYSLVGEAAHEWKEVRKDAEGMQIMRILGKNMAWFLKCKEAGTKAGIPMPEQETISFTNFIRE